MQNLTFCDGRIVTDPNICNGHPVVRGKRITVQSIIEYLGAGDSEQEILLEYPFLELEDIRACLLFASQLMARRYDVLRVA